MTDTEPRWSAIRNPIAEGDYSSLDRPPTIPGNPADVAHNVSRFRRANRLRNDADALFKAARIASFHGCYAVDNAVTQLARNLMSEADKIFKPPQDVPLSEKYKNKL